MNLNQNKPERQSCEEAWIGILEHPSVFKLIIAQFSFVLLVFIYSTVYVCVKLVSSRIYVGLETVNTYSRSQNKLSF